VVCPWLSLELGGNDVVRIQQVRNAVLGCLVEIVGALTYRQRKGVMGVHPDACISLNVPERETELEKSVEHRT